MITLFLTAIAISVSSFNVRDFGAIGDGESMCTASIQKAVDAAATTVRGTVILPAGKYLSGTIHLHSHVELHLEKGATLLGSTRRHDYDHGVWYSLLMAADVDDIAVTGSGTIDGQGAAVSQDVLRLVRIGELKIPPHGWRPSEVDRPEIIEFTRCHKVRVEGVTIKNSTCWVQTYRNCTDLSIKDVTVDSKTYWNNDGVDIVDCQKVHVSNCDIDSNDDGICLKSVGPTDSCADILVENCRVRSSASAIKFGTSSGGGFRRIKIRGIQVRDTFRSAVALESVDGGTIEDVVVEGIRALHTGNAFFIRLGHRNTRVPPGKVQRVTLRDFDIQVLAGRPDFGYPFHGPQFLEPHNLEPSSIVGHRDVSIQDVTLENIKIRFAGGGSTSIANSPLGKIESVPERPTDYPEFTMFGELPAWGLYLRHVKGLTIRNCQFFLEQTDYRPVIVADQVSGLRTVGIVVRGADLSPTIVLQAANDAKVGFGIQVRKLQ